jgi:thiamine biosynthesis lipoprotein
MVLTSPTIHERIFESARLNPVDGLYRLSFQAMGTFCRVDFDAFLSREKARAFSELVLHWVADFEVKYSRFSPHSLISRINAAAGTHWVDIDAETEALFNTCQEFNFITRGTFDPHSLAMLKLWNWKSNHPVIPSFVQIQDTLQLVGWNKVQRRPGAVYLPEKGMGLDLGGIGKEYAVDCVMQLAVESGITNVLVDFGQDLRMTGVPPGKPAWHIGLENPHHPGLCWSSLAIQQKAVATSGDYLRHFKHQGKRYGHIIDPRTGYPVDNGCRAVTVIAPSCTVAGVLATSAFMLGAEEGIALIENYFDAEGCITTETKTYESKNYHEYIVA